MEAMDLHADPCRRLWRPPLAESDIELSPPSAQKAKNKLHLIRNCSAALIPTVANEMEKTLEVVTLMFKVRL